MSSRRAPAAVTTRRRGGVGRVVVASLAALSLVPTTPPAGAQARPVLVEVRTEPKLPEPGDDVTVRVRLQGCAPGAAVVEAYLETDDGEARRATLMTRQPARVSMLWSLSATLTLTDAIEGWYGIRVLCGTFRPPREPMANTRFAVGARPSASFELGAAEVRAGTTLGVAGDRCPGREVELDLVESADVVAAFEADATVPVDAGGTWATQLAVPEDQKAQRARVRARCLVANADGRTVTVEYRQWRTVVVTDG